MYEKVLSRLSRSKFRSGFELSEKDKEYIEKKGLEELRKQIRDILKKRVRICGTNDGKQTPWKGHPVFVAQHGTGTCCRKCIKMWHGIPKDKVLDVKEIEYLSGLIEAWILVKI